MFCLEDAGDPAGEGWLFDRLGGEDRRLCLSGRCAIYYCLLDLKQRDDKRVAYLPAYTCETVIAPYKKAGYSLLFYDVSPEGLRPQFNRELIPRISVLGLCGYYGFSLYDRSFVADCAAAGVAVIHDATHSVFSADGIESGADYTVGSLRKWLGIPSGGFAVKRRGTFTLPLLPPEEEHIRGRLACFEERTRALRREGSEDRVNEIFWDTELRLRRIFDAYDSDGLSAALMARYPFQELCARRRENYAFVLSQTPFGSRTVPVFPRLEEGICPSHLALYSEDREAAREMLKNRGISSTVYWPFHGELDVAEFPGARYIYDHIYSVPVDQRYGTEDMELLCRALEQIAAD
jgi:dTDP-4-amino-4,6-dideoxygalactose transaminase